MKLSCEDHDQLSVLTIKGEFTGEFLDQFQHTVDDRVARQARDFVLNVEELEFIDSRGLESLLSLQDACAERLGQVRLAGVQGNIEQILRITRLSPRFEQYATVDEAVKSLRI